MEAITNFFELDFISLFIGICVILTALKFITSLFEWCMEKSGLETRWTRNQREEHNLLLKTSENLAKLQEKHEKDTKQTVQIQKELTDAQNKTTECMIQIISKIDQMKLDTDARFLKNEEKQNKKEQAKIKSEISKYYTLYQEKHQISDMEFEALEGLIEQYENFGGKNSFVHSIVQKEMYTWKRVNS